MRKIRKVLIVWTVICSLLVGVYSSPLSKEKSGASAQVVVSKLQNPRIVEDDSLKPGKRVTWDCIWFGSYPQTEIVYEGDSETIAALETNTYNPMYYEKVDSDTWAALTVASYNSNGDALVDGVKYRRMKSTDASTKNDSGYIWNDDSSYHYFRYDPIKWRVLCTDGKEALLLADRGLDAKPYNTEENDVTWGTSTIRSWLNGYGALANASGIDNKGKNFLDAAFDSEEKESIVATEEFDSDDFDDASGDGRRDKIFLLSDAEWENEAYGLEFMLPQSEEREDRSLAPSTYAMAQGAYLYGKGDYSWWLRSTREDHTWAGCVYTTQYSTGDAFNVFVIFGKMSRVESINLIRPALRLSLDSECYQLAGSVSSDNTVSETIGTPVETPIGTPVQTPTTTYIPLDGRLRNPQIVADDSAKSGQFVTWDCIWFGNYPQTEVIEESDAEAIERLENSKESYGYETAYEKIDSSTWEEIINADYDSRGDAVVNGVKYRRRQRKDATAKSDYKWDDGYHYFRYEPVKWRVLSSEEGEAFLLADQCLDDKPYNTEQTENDVTWETSTIRSWLNGYDGTENSVAVDYRTDNFMNDAFSSEEKSGIVVSTLENKSSNYYMQSGTIGNTTYDKVFLMSAYEVRNHDNASVYGFREDDYIADEARRAKSSTYAKAMGVYIAGSKDGSWAYEYGNSEWWLRSHFAQDNEWDDAAYVQSSGDSRGAQYMCFNWIGVRPAIRVQLDFPNLYQYAGTVCSDGTINEKAELPDIAVNPSAAPSTEPDAPQSSAPSNTSDMQPSAMPTGDWENPNRPTPSADISSPEVTARPSIEPAAKNTPSVTVNNGVAQKAPKCVTIKTIKKQRKGKIVVKYKKVSKADGYCIQYSLKKNFAGKKQQLSQKCSVKLRLRAGKKYYIRVRAYKYIYRDGKKVKLYGAWSRVRKIKAKK